MPETQKRLALGYWNLDRDRCEEKSYYGYQANLWLLWKYISPRKTLFLKNIKEAKRKVKMWQGDWRPALWKEIGKGYEDKTK